MTYGDGFAAIVGKSMKSKEYKVFGCTKTLAGSCVMFVMSLIITISVFTYSNTELFFVKAILLSMIGTDNITVPVITSLITYFII